MAGNFVSSVLIDEQSNSSDFYNQKHTLLSVDSYDRICNIFTTLLSGSEIYHEKGDGLDILINQKNLSLILKNCLSFIQKNRPDKNGIVGYLLFKHDDVRKKDQRLGFFTDFEIIPAPSLKLDRDISRAIALRDFRDEQTRASLVRACHAYDEALWKLRKSASAASKLAFTSGKMPTRVFDSNASKTETAKRTRALEQLSKDEYYLLGQGESISATSMSIDPALKSYEICKQDLSFKSGIDPEFLNFEAGTTEMASSSPLLMIEIASYRNVSVKPLINDILRVSGLQSTWHFKQIGIQSEKEKSESEAKYMATFATVAKTTADLLNNEKIMPEIQDKAQELLKQFLRITGEIDNG